jgi:hypothetical protein
MGNGKLPMYPKSTLNVLKHHFYAYPDLIQVHVAVKAVEVRVLSRAHIQHGLDAF